MAHHDPLFARISLTTVVAAQLLGLVVGLVALLLHVPPWPALGVAVVAGTAIMVPVGKRTCAQWITTLWHFRSQSQQSLGTTVDYRDPNDRWIGLHWSEGAHRGRWHGHGGHVVSVVEVLPARGELTRIDRHAVHSGHLLPVAALAQCLTQHDIVLSGIDIVSHGHRSRPGTPAAAIYESLLGPLPATASRTVWLAISFDALACPDAVARRGGNTTGACRAIAVATHRIVRTLENSGCAARILTASEIRHAVLQVSAGTQPQRISQRLGYARVDNYVNVGAAVDPRAVSSDLLAQLWVMGSLGTTVAVRLRPGGAPDTVRVGAAWRVTAAELPKRRRRRMVSMSGRHRRSLLAHLPIGLPGLDDTIPTEEYPIDVTDALQLPSAGCGQVIGSDDQGNGVAIRIVGQGISTVYVAGELYLAQQLAFRALAVGERILVRTDRPHAWDQLTTTIGNPRLLAIATETHSSDTGFTAVIVDGVLAPPPRAGVTTIYVTGDPRGWPAPEPDVSIYQPGAHGNRVTVRSGWVEEDLTVVSIPRESTYIGRPRGTSRAMANA